MHTFLKILLSVLVLGLINDVEAKTLRLVTFPIPLMVENSQAGLFIEMTRQIAKETNSSIEIKVLPPGQAILEFSNNKFDAFFPALDVYVPRSIAKSANFYNKIDYAFYRKDKPLKTIKDLEGKVVGLTFRYPYSKVLTGNKKIHFQFATDDVANMRKLSRGEIDAFVVEERSGLKALQLSGESNIAFDRNQALSEQNVYYAFIKNKRGEELASLFSQSIEKMQKEGRLEKILSPPLIEEKTQ